MISSKKSKSDCEIDYEGVSYGIIYREHQVEGIGRNRTTYLHKTNSKPGVLHKELLSTYKHILKKESDGVSVELINNISMTLYFSLSQDNEQGVVETQFFHSKLLRAVEMISLQKRSNKLFQCL